MASNVVQRRAKEVQTTSRELILSSLKQAAYRPKEAANVAGVPFWAFSRGIRVLGIDLKELQAQINPEDGWPYSVAAYVRHHKLTIQVSTLWRRRQHGFTWKEALELPHCARKA